MHTIQISDSLHKRLSNWAAERGESVEDLAEEVLTEYLEEREDIHEARLVLERIARGESKPIPWEEAEALLEEWERKGELPD